MSDLNVALLDLRKEVAQLDQRRRVLVGAINALSKLTDEPTHMHTHLVPGIGRRQCAILDFLMTGPKRLCEIADDASMAPESANRALKALCDRGLVAKASRGIYGLAPGTTNGNVQR